MKNLTVSLLFLIIVSLILHSCRSTCDKTIYYYAKIPVYGSLEAIRSGFEVIPNQPMDTIEKIVELENAYFLEEKGKGVHVVEKSSTGIPKRIAFISVPGCLSIEAFGEHLFIAQATDVIVVDVGDLVNIEKVSVVKNLYNQSYVKQDSFIVGYTERYVERVLEDTDCGDSYIYPERTAEAFAASLPPHTDLRMESGSLLGCDSDNLRSFSFSAQGALHLRTTFGISLGQNDFARIGSTSEFVVVGSPVVNLALFNTNGGNLTRVTSTFVRSPFTCGRFFLFKDAMLFADFEENSVARCNSINALFIQPINSFAGSFVSFQEFFTEPQYLSIQNTTMLLCDGSGGFGLYDISAPEFFSKTSDLFDEITNIHSHRSILSEERALVWGDDGLFYFNVKIPTSIKQIGKIE
ncbi:MAG: hypothetical protein ACI8SE_001433 [Bacteroidia bacterium]|jgi:hypothetical protein